MNCHHCHTPDQDETTHCSRCGKPTSGANALPRAKKAGRRRHGKRRDIESAPEQTSHTQPTSFPPPALLTNRNNADHRPEQVAYPLVVSSQAPSSTGKGSTGARATRPWRRWAVASLVVATAAIAFTGLSRTGENVPVIEASAQHSNARETIAPNLAENTHGKLTHTTIADAGRQAATPKKASSATKEPAKATQSELKKRDTAPARKASKPAPEPAAASDRADSMLLAAKAPAPQSKYEQCLVQDSFFSRERCKWQACSGKWGQDGCPSYQQKTDIN